MRGPRGVCGRPSEASVVLSGRDYPQNEMTKSDFRPRGVLALDAMRATTAAADRAPSGNGEPAAKGHV